VQRALDIDTHAFQATPEQMRALLEAILAISADLSLTETLQRIVAAAARLADARYAALGVPNENGEGLAEFVTTGLTPEQLARIGPPPAGHGLLGVIIREGRALRLRDLNQDPRAHGFPPHHPPMTSFLGVPIRHKGRTLGNLYLTEKQGAEEFSEADERLVELLAAHAGVAIENARLYAQVQQMRVVEERQRIGMDLHDGIIQSLFAVGLNLEYIDGQLADGDVGGARDRLRGAIGALNGVIGDIRAYILDLRPRRFEGESLAAGLQELLAEFRANTLIDVALTVEPGADQGLPAPARQALFHIAQEALSNAAKHSRASRVEVRLTSADGFITLRLRDDGHGFDPRAVERRMGHGLVNMQDRAHAQGGTVTVEGRPGEGTEVEVTLPRSG
jgi:signal transduction histidine kinase